MASPRERTYAADRVCSLRGAKFPPQHHRNVAEVDEVAQGGLCRSNERRSAHRVLRLSLIHISHPPNQLSSPDASSTSSTPSTTSTSTPPPPASTSSSAATPTTQTSQLATASSTSTRAAPALTASNSPSPSPQSPSPMARSARESSPSELCPDLLSTQTHYPIQSLTCLLYTSRCV